ncbi:MAG: carbohydrate kinase [Saprospiraceae bacterium]|nr:carbohydrate kinase [Saprospiraceae bacterium]
MKILCIGEALIDMICTDQGISLQKGNHFLKKPGGAPANVAAAIAAMGGDVYLSAKVGADPFGDLLREEMKTFGVKTDFLISDPDYFTTMAFVSIMEDGERDFVFNRGADAQLSVEDISNVQPEDFPMVHFGSATAFLPGKLQTTYLELLDKAIENRSFVSFDPNYRHLLYKDDIQDYVRQAIHFIRKCNFFKVSKEEALLLTSKEYLDEAVDELRRLSDAVFTVTLGNKGTFLSFKNHSVIIPSIKITPVDTTGAGDAFVGAVLYQLSEYSSKKMSLINMEDWRIIVTNANKAGARTCEFHGAMEAFRKLSINIFNQ